MVLVVVVVEVVVMVEVVRPQLLLLHDQLQCCAAIHMQRPLRFPYCHCIPTYPLPIRQASS